MKHAKHYFLLSCVLVAATTLGTACGPPPASTPSAGSSGAAPTGGAAPDAVDPGEPVEGDWLVTRLGAEPALLNPILDQLDANGRYIMDLVGDTLLDLDRATMEFIPRLATEWEISDDQLTYTFHLREGLVFSDNVPLTVEDVKFTFDLLKDPKTDSSAVRSYFSDVLNVEIVDDNTISFLCEKPYFGHVLTIGSMPVMPKHIYGTGDINKHPANRAPVGSGAYRFEAWDTGQQISFVRNGNYWGERPYLDKHVFKIITDDEAAFQVLTRHEIDTMRFGAEMWQTRGATPQFEAAFNKFTPSSSIPGYVGAYAWIGWNMRDSKFSDKRVRRALTLLLDRELLLAEVFGGIGQVISGSTNPAQPEYNQAVKPWPFDPDLAKQLLDEAGWIDRNKDGVREKDGIDLRFEFGFGSGVPQYDQLSTVYQEELKRAGIGMTPRPMEWATFQERLNNRKFDACMLAWYTTPLPDPYQLWHSTQADSGSNYPGLALEETDALIENIRREFDAEKRAELWHRFHEILHEEQPYTFLFARNGRVAVDKRFQNIKEYPLGLYPLEWWVPKNQQRYTK
jgi:peptide/nickel transport system substrate-binding protein